MPSVRKKERGRGGREGGREGEERKGRKEKKEEKERKEKRGRKSIADNGNSDPRECTQDMNALTLIAFLFHVTYLTSHSGSWKTENHHHPSFWFLQGGSSFLLSLLFIKIRVCPYTDFCQHKNSPSDQPR